MNSVNKYLTNEYFDTHPTWDVEDSPWKAKQIEKIINRNKLSPKLIGDIGCGAGEVLSQLHMQMDENITFVGYEISPHAFDLCKLRIKDRLQFKMENFFESNDFFDIVMAIDVFEHVESYFDFLRQFREKGKYKIFHIPLDLSVQSVLRITPILRGRERNGHLHYFTKDTALAVLKDTGYEIIDYFYTPGMDLRKTIRDFLFRLPRKIFFKINKDLAVRILGGYSLIVLAK